MMKILYISHSTGLSEGSVIALLSILQEMRRRGHDVMVTFPDNDGAKIKCDEMGIKNYVIPVSDDVYPVFSSFKSFIAIPIKIVSLLQKNRKAIKAVQKLIDYFHPDVVHTNVGTLNVGFHAAHRRSVPHVWHIREMAEQNLGWHPLPSLSYKKSLQKKNSANIAITKEVKNYYKLDDLNSFVIYDGVFNANITQTQCYPKENYFLFVGRICESKGTIWAIKAFMKLIMHYPTYRLLLVGEDGDSYAKKIKELYKNEEDSGWIQFLGFRKDVYSLMQRALALIVPSEMEGFGFITAEAMYNDCLVIGRNTGGTKEQFDNGLMHTKDEIGLRFETIDELTSHMEMICVNGLAPYRAMIKRAKECVLDLYTVERNVDQLIEVYSILTKK